MRPTTLSALKWIVSLLAENNITYQLTGGLAAHLYGADRPVYDIDLEIPDDNLTTIAQLTADYIISPPHLYRDDKFDVQLLTLQYQNEKIDISVESLEKIFDETTGQCRHLSYDWTKTQTISIDNFPIQIINPVDLITYKKIINRPEDRVDVMAIEQYLNSIN